MRHGKRINHLGRTSSHRNAMLSNMASSLILHKRISTTVAKAKELRKYVEPLLTKSKEDSTHSRRQVFSYLQNKESVRVLFDEVAERVATRPGGYTRIIKLGNRLGDNAEMCIIELVDYNELLLQEEAAKPKRRTRRAGKKSTEVEAASEKAPAKAKPAKEEEAQKEENKGEVQDVSAEAQPAAEEQSETPNTEKGGEASPDQDEKKKDE